MEECLEKYPEIADELHAFLGLAAEVQAQRAVPSAEFKSRSRLYLSLEMDKSSRGKSGSVRGWLKPLVVVSRPVFILSIIACIILVSGTSVLAAQSSLPGEPLYPVKTFTENVQLVLAVSPEARAKKNLELAEKRVEEMVTLSKQGKAVNSTIPQSVARYMDAAIREIQDVDEETSRALISQLSQSTIYQQVTLGQVLAELPGQAGGGISGGAVGTPQIETQEVLKKAAEVSLRGNLVAQVAYTNQDFLSSPPSLADDELEKSHFKVEGILLGIEDNNWNISGVTIGNIRTDEEVPSIGEGVEIEGLRRGDTIFITKVKFHEDDGRGELKIEGVFGGVGSDGNTWYMGGIPIIAPKNIGLPAESARVKLEGMVKDGVFIVTSTKIHDGNARVEISGRLVKLDQDAGTVTIEVAGSQILADISKAKIENEEGQQLKMSDLDSLLGREIRLGDLRMEDGLIYPREVYADIEKESAATEEEKQPKGKSKDGEEEGVGRRGKP